MAEHRNAAGDRIITARYAGKCRTCPNPIEIGQTISYGPNGARCMACVDGRDFTPPPQAPRQYGPVDVQGRPIQPTNRTPVQKTSPARRPLRTYEELFGED